jgi:hypothetical protein
MDLSPFRHRKLWAVMLALSVVTTLLTGAYLDFLKEWLPLIGLFFLVNLITPVNRLQSLPPICKAALLVLGIGMIVSGVSDLYHMLPSVF